MDGVKFFRDPNGARAGFNGLAVLTGHPDRGRDKAGRMKEGWTAVVAKLDGAGDGPYVADRVSNVYLSSWCQEITEAQARQEFPRLVEMLVASSDLLVTGR